MLRNLNRPVDAWNDILVFLGVQKLDRASRKAWELQLSDGTDLPTYTQFDVFLEKRIRALEALPVSKRDKPSEGEKSKPNKQKAFASHSTTSAKIMCPVCHQNHLIYQCTAFLAKSISERFQFIKQQKRCVNCFSTRHSVAQCSSPRSCKECHQRHNSLLHFPTKPDAAPSTSGLGFTSTEAGNEISANVASDIPHNASVLLSTARVRIHSSQGRCVRARALVDQGSVATLITERLVQLLRLQRTRQPSRITGISGAQSHASYAAEITVTPATSNEPAYTTTAIIMQTLTRYVPSQKGEITQWSHLSGLKLADKEPMSKEPIDVIIGADLYGQLLLPGLRKGSACTPIAQNTTLGWILSGPFHPSSPSSPGIHHVSVLENLDQNLRRFWEVEALSTPIPTTPEIERCESHFTSTHRRSPNGRYIVRLPFKTEPPPSLGESRTAALQSLRSLENRLGRDSTKSHMYREFLEEYQSLGHMKRILSSPSRENYYIPHHAVIRESSATTRLRVVFNASRRSSNGKSLNDLLLTGPKLQQDLVAILLRWRHFQFVYTADIEKMYRQILINPKDLDYQRILWRDSPQRSVEEYQLLTVTYGTVPAPFLALRVLQQLVEDEGSQFPASVAVLREQVYIDDFLFGGDTLDSTRHLRDQTVGILEKGGFTLRKWASNDSALLLDIHPKNHGLATSKSLHDDEIISVLGISWNPKLDNFHFKLSVPTELPRTKRVILSTIAKLFDPLGWIAPIIVVAKIYMQTLWSSRCDWDDVLPAPLLEVWQTFFCQLPELEHFSIPRKISPEVIHAQSLHGFSDASTKAYAAAIYSRSVLKDGSVHTSLLLAKTRVAPVKTISVPRLELCAALLLARLLKFVRTALHQDTIESHCWTDSSVTLAWLSKPPSRWKTFVANRVSKIHELNPQAQWHHVATLENPADCASRGMSVERLKEHRLWWSGPHWLQQEPPRPFEAQTPFFCTSLEEKKASLSILTTGVEHWDLVERYSSWPKLLRITAYLMHFILILRIRLRPKIEGTPTESKAALAGGRVLNPAAIQSAKIFWLRRIQQDAFPEELKALRASRSIPKTSTLLSLAPYLSDEGLMRAKGRLSNSQLSEKAKKPIILRSHPILTMLIEDTHRKLLHAGPNLTLAYLRNEFWIVRARATIRSVLYKCVACTREKADVPSELMGDLPAPRVTRVERPFIHTGVDYAGPIQIKTHSGRGQKSHKAYLAIFICLTVKAVHIELVSDYSSSAFLAAYHRFASRRGLPRSMYSDNGTTFKGANRELTMSFRSAIQSADFGNRLATDGTEWHFLPPNAPNFGGLWEAAVKSVKYHLKRTIGIHTLTFEEMTTLLCRVEACLNSRPIGPVSDSIDDYNALTPGHFLIGAPLITSPEPSVLDIRENRLSRWQLIQKLSETVWKSWSNDYLHTLHQRPKWKIKQNLTKVGQLVLVRHPNLPPSRWELGRITACHPGSDGLVRVVSIKTARSEYTRPISKICFLPIQINADTEQSATKTNYT